MNTVLKLIALTSLMGLITFCGREKMKVPENMLQPDDLTALLIDLHLADGYLHNLPTTQFNKQDSAFFIYPGILKKYGISRRQLDSTLLFYGQYPDEFSKIYDRVLEELSRMEGEARQADSIQNPQQMEE